MFNQRIRDVFEPEASFQFKIDGQFLALFLRAKTDKAYQLYLTGQTKKVAYIFHDNGDSFNIIFITIIQQKIHKHHLYFKLFSLQNIS